MAHYAFIDENNIVTQVIVGKDELEGGIDWEKLYADEYGQLCLRTSYNTVGGIHLAGGTPFRGNFAGIGYIYDQELDAFIPPKEFNSWVLDKEVYSWVAPIVRPEDITDMRNIEIKNDNGDIVFSETKLVPITTYVWDENVENWVAENTRFHDMVSA